MPFENLVNDVLSKDLCTACGACELACPQDIIKFNDLKVTLIDNASTSSCGSCMDCLTVCPGLDPETPKLEKHLFGRTRKVEERWLGIINNIYGARSTDPIIFKKSASGGSATTLLKAAMKYLELDCILVMGRSIEKPWKSAPQISSNPNELVNYAQSTYQLAPYLGALKRVFKDHPTWRIGMSGIACQVQGIRKLQQMDSDIGKLARDNIAFIIEIGCSSNTTSNGTETIITDILGVALEDVKSIRYREGEYPGEIVVHTKMETRHSVSFWEAVRHFKQNKTHRCLSCGDWMSGLADVSLSDGDPNIFKASLGLNSIEKHGRVFVRTEKGARVVDFASRTKALEIWPIELVGQNLGLDRKRSRRADYERKGVPIPAGPIPEYTESGELVSDDDYLNCTK